MNINFKAILSLFIIFAIIGLLIFSPKGQQITGNYTKPVGSFLKTMTGKITKPKTSTESRILDITLKDVNPSSLADLEIDVKGDEFLGELNYEVVSVLDSSVKFDDREIKVEIGSLLGNIAFLRNGNMKIEGKTSSIKLNGMEIAKPDINILIVGEPINFEIENVKKDKIIFPSISSSFRCPQLTSGNLMLTDDQLELVNFDGNIKEINNSIVITGKVDKITLNGIEISKS